jgi:hypothetical protein
VEFELRRVLSISFMLDAFFFCIDFIDVLYSYYVRRAISFIVGFYLVFLAVYVTILDYI